MNPTRDGTNEQLFEEFNAVILETEQLLKSVATAGNGRAGALKASVEEGLAAARDRLRAIREDAVQQAGDAARATDEYVHENPWRVVGIVAGVAVIGGLVAGLLISRR